MDKDPPASGAGAPKPGRPPFPGGERAGSRRFRAALDLALKHDAVWLVLVVAVLTFLCWRSPWTENFDAAAEGRIASADLVVPYDVEVPDEARTAAIREQARRNVGDVYVFEQRANERLDRDLEAAFASGSLPGLPDAAFVPARRKASGSAVMS